MRIRIRAFHLQRGCNIDRDQIAPIEPKVPENQRKIAQDQCSHLQHEQSPSATPQIPGLHRAATAALDEGQ
jgi:hypothetical protein